MTQFTAAAAAADDDDDAGDVVTNCGGLAGDRQLCHGCRNE